MNIERCCCSNKTLKFSLFVVVVVRRPLQESISVKYIVHMIWISTEFKTHADCIYAQNVIPSIHAPWMHTKHIHIETCTILHVRKMRAFGHTILTGIYVECDFCACVLS